MNSIDAFHRIQRGAAWRSHVPGFSRVQRSSDRSRSRISAHRIHIRILTQRSAQRRENDGVSTSTSRWSLPSYRDAEFDRVLIVIHMLARVD